MHERICPNKVFIQRLSFMICVIAVPLSHEYIEGRGEKRLFPLFPSGKEQG